MNTSERYVEMSSQARELQLKKYKEGFEEGDYVFDGKKVRIIGHDFINVKEIFGRTGNPVIYFAQHHSLANLPISFDQDFPTGLIEVRDGEYIVEKLVKGVWIPRQDQLQKILGKERFIGHWDGEYFNPSCFYIWFEQNHLYCITNFTSMEQLWLAFVMMEKYKKIWDGEKWVAQKN